jgi:hypothetical protein
MRKEKITGITTQKKLPNKKIHKRKEMLHKRQSGEIRQTCVGIGLGEGISNVRRNKLESRR